METAKMIHQNKQTHSNASVVSLWRNLIERLLEYTNLMASSNREEGGKAKAKLVL